MKLSKSILFSLLYVIAHNAYAINCSAVCPEWPVGILAGSDELIIVSPPSISSKFSGCQIAWNSNHIKRITIEYELGEIIKISTLNDEKEYSTCIYREGKSIAESAPICEELIKQMSHFNGIDSMPVKKEHINWPEEKCFPELK